MAPPDVVVGKKTDAEHRRIFERDGDPPAVLAAVLPADAAVLRVSPPRRGVGGQGDEGEKDEECATHGAILARSPLAVGR